MGLLPWSVRRSGAPETSKTRVVCLITQRSQVQILPPLPGQRPLPGTGGAFCVTFVNGFANGILVGPPRPRPHLGRLPHLGAAWMPGSADDQRGEGVGCLAAGLQIGLDVLPHRVHDYADI
jgi:hypothetical protein